MDSYQLKYFQTLAKEKNITKAAEKLSLSQPALSRSISRLEEEIGVPLFERKNRGVTLNNYGEIFLQHTNLAIAELEEATKKIADMVHPYHGTISLAFIETLGSSYMPNLIGKFKKQFPSVTFQLSQDTTNHILKQLEDAEINIGFCSPQELAMDFDFSLIVKEELFVIVPIQHRLSCMKEIDLAEIADEPFILFKEETALRDVIDKLCHEAGFIPKIAFEGLEERTVVNLVAANFGVAIIPQIPNLDEQKISLIRIRKPQSFREIYMVWKEKGYMSPAVSTFKRFVIEHTKGTL